MALDFDGSNDVVTHGDIAAVNGATKLTIGIWVWVDTLEASAHWSDKSVSAGAMTYGFGYMNDGTANVTFRGNSVFHGRTTSGTAIATGAWAYWALVYDAAGATNDDKVKIYKNLTDLGPLTFDTAPPASLVSSTGLVAAMRDTQQNVYLDGRCAHHRIWTAALTLAELTREMKSYLPVRRTSLILDGSYDDKTGRDYSGRGNHGTITEAAQITGPPGLNYGGRVLRPRGRRTLLRRQPTALTPVRAWYGL